ncbi:MAG: DciA family protein [Acidimicrobiia bacterium]
MTRRWRWTGEEEDRTRPPRTLSESLSEIAWRLHLDEPEALAGLYRCWAMAVGPSVARHARPRSLRKGVLVVEVDSPEWATQLRFLEYQVLERLAEAVRPGVVRGLRMVVRPERW